MDSGAFSNPMDLAGLEPPTFRWAAATPTADTMPGRARAGGNEMAAEATPIRGIAEQEASANPAKNRRGPEPTPFGSNVDVVF